MPVQYTIHGEKRANQRGFRRRDVEMVRRYGTLISDHEAEVYLLRNKDVEQEISTRKQEIQQLERMRGCQVVIADNHLVTILHTNRKHEKALLRRAG